MSGETLFEIACEMLQATNVFSKDISEIRYHNHFHKEVSLLNLVEKKTKKHNHRFRGKSEENLQRVYSSIADAMLEYVEEYPVSFSYKQRAKKNFVIWLDKINEVYTIMDPAKPEELTVNETDTGIAMLKLLHSRDGVTYEDIHSALGIEKRAIQKDLVKLSPSLYTGDQKPYVPFRLGGQPLRAEISLVSETEKAEEKRFYTLNTVHPLVLQENVMQLATLLKSLAHQFYDHSDDLASHIAIDIWSQMSEYAKKKIIDYFAFDDQDLAEFIEILEDECPDDHVCAYHTEREMLAEIEMPMEQKLQYLMKAPGRTATIEFQNGKRVDVRQLAPQNMSDGTKVYETIDGDGNRMVFAKDQVKEIYLH